MIYLYAEVLANIRQANFYASLQTQKNEHTRIDIASDKKTVTVSHDGEIASIYLPTEISGTAQVDIPIDRGKEMAARLELANIMDMPAQVETAFGSEGPWSAKDLSPTTRIRCRNCNVDLLRLETLLDIKDLPSENWAEMMDLWHCHKPQDAHTEDGEDLAQAANSKGYGSHTKLKASPGTALVDTASFLLAESSWTNIQVGQVL